MLADNHVAVMGTLSRDPIVRTVGSAGTKLTTLSLCINEKRRTPDGKVIENVVFVDVDAWSKLAEMCEKHLKKHSNVFVDGSLIMAQWEKDGQKHQKIKIRAKNIKFLPKQERKGNWQRNEDARNTEPVAVAVKDVDEYEGIDDGETMSGFESDISKW